MSISIKTTPNVEFNKKNDINVVNNTNTTQNQVKKENNVSSTSNLNSKLTQTTSTGKSSANLSFVDNNPILNIPKAKAGDKFNVDGPLWYDGTATLKKYDQNTMEFDISMKAAKKVLGVNTNIPYEIKNGKISLSVKLEKTKDNEYILTTTDHNNSDKKDVQKVKSTGTDKNLTMTDKYGNKTSFTIKSNGDMSIKTAGAPFSLDLTKKS